MPDWQDPALPTPPGRITLTAANFCLVPYVDTGWVSRFTRFGLGWTAEQRQVVVLNGLASG